jgi:hypothetical protein
MPLVVAVSSVRERTIPGMEPGIVFPLLGVSTFTFPVAAFLLQLEDGCWAIGVQDPSSAPILRSNHL